MTPDARTSTAPRSSNEYIPAPDPDAAAEDEEALQKEATLLDLVDRLLDKGVVLSGDVTLSVADVDLVYVGLRVLVSSVEAAQRRRGEGRPQKPGAE